jgi:hypothetical protein
MASLVPPSRVNNLTNQHSVHHNISVAGIQHSILSLQKQILMFLRPQILDKICSLLVFEMTPTLLTTQTEISPDLTNAKKKLPTNKRTSTYHLQLGSGEMGSEEETTSSEDRSGISI